METDEPLTMGQTVECAFFLPGGLKVATNGRVVRVAEPGMVRQFGIEFVDLPAGEAATLQAFVKKWRKLLSPGGHS